LDADRLDAYRVAVEFQVLAAGLLPGRRFPVRGSATESAAILDLLRARGLISGLDYRRGRALLVRVIQMLSRLSRLGSRRQ
ncbi:MAG TPA: hypothetical protein VGL15_17120, partial [Vicinamibacteria bacterium]